MRGRALALLVVTLGVACSGERELRPGSWTGTVDTVDGVITVNNPATPIWGGQTAWRVEETLSIGVVEGDPDYQFSEIAHVEVGKDGSVYVADRDRRRVAVYDSTGRFLFSFGRQGGGPGEFEAPTAMTWKGDTLVTWDRRLRRFSYFDADGTLLREEPLQAQFSPNGFAVRSDGAFLVQRGPEFIDLPAPEAEQVGWLLVFDPVEQSVDTLLRWTERSSFVVRGEGYPMVLPIRYAPQLHWATADNGMVFVARGHEYEIEVFSPEGQQVMEIRRVYSRFPPSAAERAFFQGWIESFAERYPPMKDRIIEAFELADPKRATGAIFVSDDGGLWVRSYTEHDLDTYTWDVYDSEGRFLSSVVTPSAIYIFRIIGEMIYASYWDELGVPYVKRYAIRKPP